MSQFVFSDGFSISLNLKGNSEIFQLNNTNTKKNNTKFIKSKLTIYLEDTLNYMQENNLIPELPEIMNVKYINLSTKEILVNKVKDLFGQKPEQYNYPASTNISDGTIYISNYFQEDFTKDQSIQRFREQFNQNITHTIEYAFFHEIGHLFLIEKNKDKVTKQENTLFKSLTINIEEGFSESFAIHMMCLKYPQLELETNNFKKFQEKTNRLSLNMRELFYYKKHNQLKKPLLQEVKDFIQKPEIKIEEIFNAYEFQLIYKNTPFKDIHGKLITDMTIIFDKCLEISLKNNTEVIKSKTTNEYLQEFNLELIENLQKMVKNPSSDLEELITSFHNKVNSEGFLNSKITGMRKLYLNNDLNLNKNSP